jgi:hypothetical protein
MTPDLLIAPEGQKDLLRSSSLIAIRIDHPAEDAGHNPGTPVAVTLDLVVTMSGQLFGADNSILKRRSWNICADGPRRRPIGLC